MNKRLLGLLIGLAAIVVIVIVSCVVFIIGDVKVESTSACDLQEDDINKIITDSEIIKFSSIFGLDEDVAVNNIEANNPKLKVISIERKFPNTVEINVTNRVEIFYIKTASDTYFLLDRELKIVEEVEELPSSYLTNLECVDPTNLVVGQFVDIDWLANIIEEAESLSFVNARFSTFITNINAFDLEQGKQIQLKTNTGVVIVIYDNESLKLFFNAAYTYYINNLTSEQKTSGYILLSDSSWIWTNSL